MKKAALLLALMIIAACFCWYIFDPDFSDRWIGHQSENIQAPLPEDTFRSDRAMVLPASLVTTEPEQPSQAATDTLSGENPGVNGWSLVWADEFDSPLLSMEYWTEVDRNNNFNRELQYYTPANSYIDNGCLVLTASKEAKEDKQYTSGMVQTCDKLEMHYGRIEARISLPVAQGIFPAFWLTNDSDRYELDILEMVGCEPGNIYGVCHYWKKERRVKTYGMLHIENPEEFHVYALEWDEDEVRWYVDDEMFFSTRAGVPDEDMYILLTLAVGGDWPGSPDSTTRFPVSMKLDYIRLYHREASGGIHDIS